MFVLLNAKIGVDINERSRCMIITIASHRGGCGKSQAAIHLANYLSQRRGAPPLAIVDTDKTQAVKNWYERSEWELPFQVFNENDLPADWDGDLIIDSPGGIDDEQLLKYASGSNLVVIPCLPTAFSLEATIATLSRVKHLTNFRILLNNVPPPPSKLGEKAIEAIDDAKLPRFKRTIKRRVIYAEVELEGLPTSLLPGAAAKQAWEDYVEVGKEVVRVLKNE